MATKTPSSAPKRPVGETIRLVKDRFEAGLTPREIALGLGISTQAVHQHLARLRDAGQLEEASA